MSAKTRAEVKNRWNSKAYDRIVIVVKAGEKERMKSIASADGKSLNRWITEKIGAKVGKEDGGDV